MKPCVCIILASLFFSPPVHCQMPNVAHLPPTLAWPDDKSSIRDTLTPLLRWNAAAGADRYWVQVDKDGSFEFPEVEDSTILIPHRIVVLGSTGLYYWRVSTRAGDGHWSEWSDIRSFAITPACSFAIHPLRAWCEHSGSAGTVNVTAEEGCAWTAESNDTWISVIRGTAGSRSGFVTYSVSPNLIQQLRKGSIRVAGVNITITQGGAPHHEIDDHVR